MLKQELYFSHVRYNTYPEAFIDLISRGKYFIQRPADCTRFFPVDTFGLQLVL